MQTHSHTRCVWVNSSSDCCSAAKAVFHRTAWNPAAGFVYFVSISVSVMLREVTVICHKQLRILAFSHEYITGNQRCF